jgi:CheY-like chemotaxis protein
MLAEASNGRVWEGPLADDHGGWGPGRVGRLEADAPALELAAATAHDLNNVLTGLFGGLDLLDAALEERDRRELNDELRQIREAADRLLGLSRLLAARAMVHPPPPPLPTPGSARRTRVLVVEDEPTLRELITHALRTAHDVEPCARGEVVVERVRGGERFDAILCDLMLPSLDGPGLYEALQALAPAQSERLVFMTGGACTARVQAFLDAHRGPTLSKPFSMQVMRQVVGGVAALPW